MLLKILKRALLTLIVLIGILAIVVALQPDTYRISRSATMAAPGDVVFAQVNDFRKWDAWSPWAKLDPNVKNTFSEPASGTGATYSWAGSEKVGEGKMTITESKPSEHIAIKLEFFKPYADSCNVDFNFKPASDKTDVTWTMNGKKDFMGKAVWLFLGMENKLSNDFDQGLAQMKVAAESAKK